MTALTLHDTGLELHAVPDPRFVGDPPVWLVTLRPPVPRHPLGPFSLIPEDRFYREALAARLAPGDRPAALRLLNRLAGMRPAVPSDGVPRDSRLGGLLTLRGSSWG